MDQNSFRGILRKYLRGQASPEEKQIIDRWYADMEEDPFSVSDQGDEAELEARYWSAISSHMRRGTRSTPYSDFRYWPSIGIAASILIAVVFYVCQIQQGPAGKREMLASRPIDTIGWQHISNTGDLPQRVTLPDSSKVTLQPRSKLRFSTVFGKEERKVCLEGEAFFEVAHNEKVPFLVHVNRLTTKVLGTSFTVKAFRSESNVTVEVMTGKVSVYMNKKREKDTKTDEIILTPNQKIVYDKTVNKLSRMIVDVPKVIVPAEEFRRMRFESAPVGQIFNAIEKVYGVDIVYDQKKFSGCMLTTAISDGDIYNRLDIICKVIGASYEIKEDRIVISGSGCNNE